MNASILFTNPEKQFTTVVLLIIFQKTKTTKKIHVRFDSELYLSEMHSLIVLGKQKFLAEHSGFLVYTINIFTDPDWMFSAISFDAYENAQSWREKRIIYLKEACEYSAANGHSEQLKLLSMPVRTHYHGGIEVLHRLVEVVHDSFKEDWQYEAGSNCWATLDPLLRQIGRNACQEFGDLNLHEDAELSVTGSNFDLPLSIFSLRKTGD